MKPWGNTLKRSRSKMIPALLDIRRIMQQKIIMSKSIAADFHVLFRNHFNWFTRNIFGPPLNGRFENVSASTLQAPFRSICHSDDVIF